MAASTSAISAPVLSQNQRRAALRKERRRRKRQALAQVRECDLKNTAEAEEEEEEEVNDGSGEENDAADEERLRLHEEWLERERLAQEEFRLKSEREEAVKQRKEEEERMIKEEWESQQRREQEEKEQRQQEKRDREAQATVLLLNLDTLKEKNLYNTFSPHNKDEAVQKMLDEAENQLQNGPWMNPEAPVTVKSENYGTERDIANCPFFLKTGACRFGDRCSRKHVYPTASPTLMVRGMFTTFGMEEVRRDDYDIDACLEHSEEELHESFLDFYHDVLPEFKSVGRVVQFKVCCNHELHLRGNVYVQFETEEQCKEALVKFNGRWYAGRQLHCEISPVTRWKNAICGLFDRQKCPKGKHCNFLHVFRNPGREFWEADRDLHISPDRNVKGSRSDRRYSERYKERSWRQRRYSRSPVRSERSHSRREDDRQRSRSRERRDSHQHRQDKQSSRSRHGDRTDRRRSRDRSRSRSRDGEQRSLRIRSRDKDRERNYRKRSEERDSRDEDEDAGENSRSTSRERKRIKQSKERSSKKADKSKKMPPDSANTPHHHKRSKKSKKSKKKHKKKSHTTDVTTSSGESEKEKESEEETEDNSSTRSPSGDINETEITQENTFNDSNLCSEVKSEQSNTEIRSEQSENGNDGPRELQYLEICKPGQID